MKYFFLFLTFLLLGQVNAQFEKNYIPIPVEDTIPAKIYSQLKTKLDQDKSLVEDPKSQVGSYIRSLYDKRFNMVLESFNRDYFITEGELASYLQQILKEVYDANPELPRETNIYIYRSPVSNAISFGDGTIGFTLGLLSRMENKAQIAFVICHELAHYHSKHSDKAIYQLAQLNYDKELSKKIKNIKSSEYNQYTRLKALFKDVGFSVNKHNRDHEFEADSIGLVYYSKTNYDLLQTVRTMEILDSVDQSLYKENIDFKRLFDFKEYPFKDSWLSYTKSDIWHASTDDEGNDTTRTHPSCKKRIVALTRQIERLHKSSHSPSIDRETLHVRRASEFELIESAYHFKQYGQAMFGALILADIFPDNAYLHARVGGSLFEMYRSQKNHELGKVLELPDPRFEENYDRFLTFIHTLRLGELAALSYYYLVNGKESFFSTEDYMYSLWMCCNLDISKLDPYKVKMEYEEKFPRGRYLKKMVMTK